LANAAEKTKTILSILAVWIFFVLVTAAVIYPVFAASGRNTGVTKTAHFASNKGFNGPNGCISHLFNNPTGLTGGANCYGMVLVAATGSQSNLIRVMEVISHGSIGGNGSQANVTATCPFGWTATGGGFSGGATGVFVTASEAKGNPPNAWSVSAANTALSSRAINAIVMCARAP